MAEAVMGGIVGAVQVGMRASVYLIKLGAEFPPFGYQ
jgi:hypothetical protein